MKLQILSHFSNMLIKSKRWPTQWGTIIQEQWFKKFYNNSTLGRQIQINNISFIYNKHARTQAHQARQARKHAKHVSTQTRQARSLADSFYIMSITGVFLRDLVRFGQFKIREKHLRGVILVIKLQAKACNFTKSNSPKLY